MCGVDTYWKIKYCVSKTVTELNEICNYYNMGDFSTSVVSHMATLCSLLGGDRCRNVREGREAPGVPVEAY